MSKRIVIVVLVILGMSVGASTADFKDLKHRYEKHLIVLRSPLQHGNQEFDSSGNPLKVPQSGEWRIYGPILVRKLSVDSGNLRLEALRVAFGSDQQKKKNVVLALDKSLQVTIHLDHPLQSADQAQEILDRVCFSSADTSNYPQPTFLRPDQAISPNEVIYSAAKKEVQPPVPKFTPDPDYSDAARDAKYQGKATLLIVLDKAGTVARITIAAAAGMGLDEKAVEKIKTWRFDPATLEGHAVAYAVSVDTEFHLY